MKMRRSLKSRGNDYAVVLLCLFLSFTSLFLFWKDVNRTLSKIGETPIGTITFKYKVAQRKFADRLIWDRLQKESYVYNGDTIRTANLSEATIRFTDDNVITLEESSLAQIFLDSSGSASVDFAGGGIRIDSSQSASGISVSSGNTNFRIDSGSVMVASSGAGTGTSGGVDAGTGVLPDSSAETGAPGILSFEVISGTASVTDSGSGELVNLSLGEGGSVSGEGVKKEPGITVLSPLQNSRFNNYGEGLFSVPFSVAKSGELSDSSVILEISETKDFETLRETVSLKGINQVNVDLPEGVWHWRISSRDSAGEQTVNTGKFTVTRIPKPVLLVPGDKEVYSYRTVKPSIRFVWQGNQYASWYLLEVFGKQSMESPVVSRRVSGTSAIIDEFDKGDYVWRVTPVYSGEGNSGAVDSGFSSFGVNDKKEFAPPKLTSYPSGSFVNINAVNNTRGQSVLFSWENDKEADEYLFRIISSGDGKVLKEVSVNENYINVNPVDFGITQGVYYWQVAKKDKDGNISPDSEKREFTAVDGEVVFHTTFPANGYGIAENLVYDMLFAWKNNTNDSVIAEIALDEDFSNIIVSKTVGYENQSVGNISLSAGEYWWRIRTEHPFGGGESLKSKAHKFSVLPPLPAPGVVFPLNGEVIPVAKDELTEFIWQEVPGADYYNLSVYSSANSDPVQEFKMLTEPGAMVNLSALSKGSYRYTVQAFSLENENQTRRTGLITEVYFSVYPVIPIELVSPGPGTKIDGIEAVLNPGVLVWNSEDELVSEKLILSKSRDGLPVDHGGKIRNPESIVLEITSPEERIRLPPLREGFYYWTVTGINTVGYDLTPRSPYTFEVLPVPSLAAPDFVSPENKTVFDIYYLMNSTLCNVTWNQVENATGYNVTLQRIEGSSKTVILEDYVEDSGAGEYLLPDFSELGEGEFEFIVEAVQYTLDNFLLRGGETGVLSFSIQLPEIKNINLKTHGEVYGN